jgi:UDP-N-acetylmuramoylalanine-D-glutamate ligase
MLEYAGKRVVVAGGGGHGAPATGILAGLGAQVTVLDLCPPASSAP